MRQGYANYQVHGILLSNMVQNWMWLDEAVGFLCEYFVAWKWLEEAVHFLCGEPCCLALGEGDGLHENGPHVIREREVVKNI